MANDGSISRTLVGMDWNICHNSLEYNFVAVVGSYNETTRSVLPFCISSSDSGGDGTARRSSGTTSYSDRPKTVLDDPTVPLPLPKEAVLASAVATNADHDFAVRAMPVRNLQTSGAGAAGNTAPTRVAAVCMIRVNGRLGSSAALRVVR
jgi:hypothetical protein